MTTANQAGTAIGSSRDPAATTPVSEISFGPDGSLIGVDGLLNQIAAALAREAAPVIRDTVLPALRDDTALQDRVGAAAGKAIVDELRPTLWILAGAAAVLTGFYVYRHWPNRDES